MDYEQILRQFNHIDQKVKKVIDVCKTFEAQNLELLNKIEKLEEELQTKIEAENNYNAEKALIRSKIDRLLVRLEDVAGV